MHNTWNFKLVAIPIVNLMFYLHLAIAAAATPEILLLCFNESNVREREFSMIILKYKWCSCESIFLSNQ